jgi:hypothetical protein
MLVKLHQKIWTTTSNITNFTSFTFVYIWWFFKLLCVLLWLLGSSIWIHNWVQTLTCHNKKQLVFFVLGSCCFGTKNKMSLMFQAIHQNGVKWMTMDGIYPLWMKNDPSQSSVVSISSFLLSRRDIQEYYVTPNILWNFFAWHHD